MWKSWIPFRKKQRDDDKKDTYKDHGSGKENDKEENPLFRDVGGLGISARGPPQPQSTPLTNSYVSEQSFASKSHVNGSDHLSSNSNNASLYSLCQQQNSSFTNGERIGRKRDLSSSFSSDYISRGTRDKKRGQGLGGENDSFSTVHGPLLSTPIMPKVRRVIETQSGMRSPALSANRPSLLARGRPIGRSASLNYGSTNPAQSAAGQVPWVRLKRRESIALADIVKGRATNSPNTIRIAAPEPSHLLPAPSFRTTPLIVTTEANRSRVIDTQTVVSALREKRKRIAGVQQEEIIPDETVWQSSAKRRRQDSSQSNASSVSIPPMPETLPNLMVSSEATMLHHIENATIQQRPSTVPSIDAYVNRHIHDVGLGGDQMGNMHMLHQIPVKQYGTHQSSANRAGCRNNGDKLTQRALQSSLSSSIRARNNLSLLERGGIDLNRIRSNSFGTPSNRRTSFSSDVSMLDKSSRQQSPSSAIEMASTCEGMSPSTASSTRISPNSGQTSVSTVSAPTKRKIAESVMLRKQNLSIHSSPLRTQKPAQSIGLVGTVDYEQDRDKEYQRRVLDLLTDEDATVQTSSGVGSSSTAIISSTAPLTSANTVASSAATSAAVSASLDSLNKFVQSTTKDGKVTSPLVVSSVVDKSAIPSLGAPATTLSLTQSSTSSADASSIKPSSAATSSLLSSMLNSSNTPSLISTQAANSSTVTSTSSQGLSSSAGFQMNFGSTIVSSGASSSVASQVVPDNSSKTSPSVQFSFGASSVASSASPSLGTSAPSTGFQIGALQAQAGLGGAAASVPSGIVSFGSQPVPSSAGSLSSNPTASVQSASVAQPGFSFGSQQPSQASLPVSSSLSGTTGGFNFNLASASATPNSGVPSLNSQQTSNSNSGTSSPFTHSGGSMLGGFGVSLSSGGAIPTASTVGSSSTGAGGIQFSTTTTSAAPASTFLNAANSAAQPGVTVFGAAAPASSAPPAALSVAASSGQGFSFGTVKTQPALAPTSQVQSSFNVDSASSQPKPGLGGGFNFGQPASASVTSAAPNSGLFSFGGAPTGSSAVSSTTPLGASPFGAVSNAGNPSSVFSASSSIGASSSVGTSSAGFGAFGSNPPTATSAPTFGNATPNTGSVSSQPSAFGQPPAMTAASAFVFGAQPPNNAQPQQPPAFGTTLSSSTSFGSGTNAPPSIFGSNPPVTKAPAYGSTNAAASGVSVFGATANSAIATNPPSVFGGSSSNAATNFGSGATPQVSAFGSSATPQVSAFGSSATPQVSAFGSSATPQVSAFGSSATPQVSVFGSGAATQAGAFGSGATPQASTFGTGATTQAGAFGSGQASQPSIFGSGASATTQASVFGAGSTGQPSAFGATTATQPSVFGASATPQAAAFGTTPQPAAFGATATTQPTVFGSGQATQSSVSVFGAGSTPSQPSVFGSGSQQPSVFGAGQVATNQPSAPFNSGMSATAQPAGAFGSGGSASVFGATSPTAPAFGTPSASQQPPAFGSTASTGGVSVFGAGAGAGSAPAGGAGGMFTFNAGQNQAPPANVNPFNATATNSASAGFNFKQPAPQATNPASGFNFGAQAQMPTPKPASAGFNFGAAATPGTGAPSFNFNAAQNNPNMFTPSTPGTASRPRAAARRPVRRGTRK